MKATGVAGLACVVMVLVGCSNGSDDAADVSPPAATGSASVTSEAPTTPAGQPKTLDAAVKAGQEYSDRYTSGDYEGAWLLAVPRTREGISQEDFATLAKTCDASAVLPITVTGVRLEGESAVVRLSIEKIGAVTRKMSYVDGQWLQEPSESMEAGLGKPVADIIAAEKKTGDC